MYSLRSVRMRKVYPVNWNAPEQLSTTHNQLQQGEFKIKGLWTERTEEILISSQQPIQRGDYMIVTTQGIEVVSKTCLSDLPNHPF